MSKLAAKKPFEESNNRRANSIKRSSPCACHAGM